MEVDRNQINEEIHTKIAAEQAPEEKVCYTIGMCETHKCSGKSKLSSRREREIMKFNSKSKTIQRFKKTKGELVKRFFPNIKLS